MAVILGILPIDHRIMAVDAHRSMVMRDGEGKDLPVDLVLAFHCAKELDGGPHRERHAVRVLAVRDVKCCSSALHLARQEWEVHVVRGHEEGHVPGDEVANARRQLGELVVSECLSFEPHRVIGLGAGAN